MKTPSHCSAKPSHYNKDAKHYDAFNEKSSAVINNFIDNVLKKHNVKTVLDLTCGTGSQVFWLKKCGYEVVRADINANMLRIAKSKARSEKADIKFLKGDMRTLKMGKFDAVITIFNAVGHLTKVDFEKAMRNIHANLKDGGLYIFDINNLSYLLKDNRITDLTIDWQRAVDSIIARYIQYNTISKDGILASYTTSYTQQNHEEPRMQKKTQTLQIYTAEQLKDMLQKNGFSVLNQCEIDGSKFVESESDRIMTIAENVQ